MQAFFELRCTLLVNNPGTFTRVATALLHVPWYFLMGSCACMGRLTLDRYVIARIANTQTANCQLPTAKRSPRAQRPETRTVNRTARMPYDLKLYALPRTRM